MCFQPFPHFPHFPRSALLPPLPDPLQVRVYRFCKRARRAGTSAPVTLLDAAPTHQPVHTSAPAPPPPLASSQSLPHPHASTAGEAAGVGQGLGPGLESGCALLPPSSTSTLSTPRAGVGQGSGFSPSPGTRTVSLNTPPPPPPPGGRWAGPFPGGSGPIPHALPASPAPSPARAPAAPGPPTPPRATPTSTLSLTLAPPGAGGGVARSALLGSLPLSEPPGFQLLLRCRLHTAAVTALAVTDGSGARAQLLVGDADGHVALLDLGSDQAPDLTHPGTESVGVDAGARIEWQCHIGGPSHTSISTLAVTTLPPGLTPAGPNPAGGSGPTAGSAVIYALTDGAVGAVCLSTGTPLGKRPLRAPTLPTPPTLVGPGVGPVVGLQGLDPRGYPSWLQGCPFTQASLSSQTANEMDVSQGAWMMKRSIRRTCIQWGAGARGGGTGLPLHPGIAFFTD